jgi:FkbM family methyltransferase
MMRSRDGKGSRVNLRALGRSLFSLVRQARQIVVLKAVRMKAWSLPNGSAVSLAGYRIRITDGPNLYIQYKDIFVHHIYRFVSEKKAPFIVDGGSNIGMSILYFKKLYPQARVTGFEPDPYVFSLLKENIERNGITDVDLICSGLGAQPGDIEFFPDSCSGGRVSNGEAAIQVRIACLSDYLQQEVDFLKLNIEGQELPVLAEIASKGRLRMVKQLVVEYHGWPWESQGLHAILDLLDSQGYRYLVHDFDAETCGSSKPPFDLSGKTEWYCLVYAKRQG